MKIGIDIDGVLADFNSPFIALVKKQTGIQLPSPSATYPDTWNYHTAGGVTKAQDEALWAYIMNSEFWGQLPALPGCDETIERLKDHRYAGDNVYFITSRPGRYAKLLTEQWLQGHGMRLPTVLLASSKGPIARGLQLDVFIDDKKENIEDVMGVSGNVFLVDRPYNQDPALDFCRISSALAALDYAIRPFGFVEKEAA